MYRALFIVLVFVFFAACGKNDGVYPVGSYSPYGPVQAPPPPGGSVMPMGGGPYGPNQFYPQMPPGYPPQYTPFLPIDNYYRNNPQMMPYWNQVWNGWLGYAGNQGYNPYDIGHFWTEYCPSQMSGQFSNYYLWVTPQTSCDSCSTDPGTFWANYIGYSYGSCDSCGY